MSISVTEQDVKPIEAWDADDVLFQSKVGVVAWSNATFGTELEDGDYRDKWEDMWGISAEAAEKRRLIFIESGGFDSFEPMNGAREVLEDTAMHVQSRIVVTSRRESLRGGLEVSLDKHFYGIFSKVVLATDFVNGVKVTRPKDEICHEEGATSLTDDQHSHCLCVARAGIEGRWFIEESIVPDGHEEHELLLPTLRGWHGIKERYEQESGVG